MEVNKQLRAEIAARRDLAYTRFLDSLKGLKEAIRIIDERITQDGPRANYSVNSDLVNWSMEVWKASNRIHNIDSLIEEMDLSERAQGETNKV